MIDFNKYLLLCLVAVCALVACTTEVPVTVEVHLTREVEVTREIEVTREVEVTKEVKVIQEVVVLPASLRFTLCADYPYITELAQLQLGLFHVRDADPAISGLFKKKKTARDWFNEGILRAANLLVPEEERFTNRIQTARDNQIEICGHDLEPIGTMQREMLSFEGVGVCTDTFGLIQGAVTLYPDWDNTPPEVTEAWSAMLDGYINYCDNDFQFQE